MKVSQRSGTFMLNDKDRMHSDKIPNSAPMAYIMKGSSLPTDDLQFIVDNCQKETSQKKNTHPL